MAFTFGITKGNTRTRGKKIKDELFPDKPVLTLCAADNTKERKVSKFRFNTKAIELLDLWKLVDNTTGQIANKSISVAQDNNKVFIFVNNGNIKLSSGIPLPETEQISIAKTTMGFNNAGLRDILLENNITGDVDRHFELILFNQNEISVPMYRLNYLYTATRTAKEIVEEVTEIENNIPISVN